MKGLRGGTLLFQEALGVGVYRNEPAVQSADSAEILVGRIGRLHHRPAVSAEILAGGLSWPISAGQTAAAEFFGRGPPPSLTAVSF